MNSDVIKNRDWVLAHTVAYPLAVLLGFIALHLFGFIGNLLPEIYASGLGYVIWGAIIGGGIGLVQWLFLRKKTDITSGWIWRSAIGFGIAELLGVFILILYGIDRNIDIVFSYGMEVWTLIYLVGGAITGYLQSSYLKKITPNFRFWTLTNSIIWGLSTLVWTGLVSTGVAVFNLIGIILAGAVLGVLSAYALNKFFKFSFS